MAKNGMRPVSPGEIIRQDVLEELGMSATRWHVRSAFRQTGLPPSSTARAP
jgi:hypothetical protein